MSEHDKKHIDELSGTATTGHEWDGIRELDTPLPRWWLIIFYASIAISVIYWVLMPAWPGLPGMPANADHTTGLRNHSDRAIVATELADLRAARAPDFQKLVALDFDTINPADPALADILTFAQRAGESAFGDNCATCHGAGAQGFVGYPNLNDDDWIWGGAPAAIAQTIRHGIRNEDAESRYSLMPAYGRDGILTDAEIDAVTDHVLSLSGGGASTAQGAEVFATQCAACHGGQGEGGRQFGAPRLSDAIWLYGGERSEVRAQIVNPRLGVMPPWDERLDEGTIRALALYVHGRGGGEPAVAPAAGGVAQGAAPAVE